MVKLFQIDHETGDMLEVAPEIYLGTEEGSRRGFALDDLRPWEAYLAAARQLGAARDAMEKAGRPITNADLTPTAQRILRSTAGGRRRKR